MTKIPKMVYYYVVWECPGHSQGSFVCRSEEHFNLLYTQKRVKTLHKNAMVTGFFPITKKAYDEYIETEL
jgi:hypothetical protein